MMNKISRHGGKDYLDWRQGSGDIVEIFEIEVSTDRRKGIGKSLVMELLRRVPMTTQLVWVLTRTDNHIACCFYSSLGFKTLAVLRDFYGQGEDAVMYGKYKRESGEEWQ
jgi:ribosomal protein S18 acetylase RimI-like enzyme